MGLFIKMLYLFAKVALFKGKLTRHCSHSAFAYVQEVKSKDYVEKHTKLFSFRC